MTSDVVVIGGGAIGCAISWRLAQGGLATVLVERHRVGGEASGAAAGILSAQAEGEGPGPFLELLLEAERRYPSFLEELAEGGALQLGYRRRGTLRVAANATELAALATERTWQRAAGLEVQALSAAELRALEPTLSPGLLGASFFPSGAQIENQALVAALSERARTGGVTFCNAAAAGLLLTPGGGRVRGVQLAEGRELSARQVVVAAGAWSGALVGLAPDAIQPVRGQMLRYRATEVAPTRVVFGAGGYLVPRAGGFVIVGSTMEWAGFDKAVTAQGRAALARRAGALCPGLSTLAPESEWAGLRPATADGFPALGPTPIAGLHLAVGHLRNGILLTPLTADLVTAPLLGEPSRVPAPFAAARLFA